MFLPPHSLSSAIGIKKSPIHSRLEKETVAWRDVSGWAGAMYYADFKPEYGWGKENYHEVWEAEVRTKITDPSVQTGAPPPTSNMRPFLLVL